MKYRVKILPSGKVIEAKGGTLLLEVLFRAGEFIEAICSGRGLCGNCVVKVVRGGGSPEDGEVRLLGEARTRGGFRLSCMARVSTDMEITLLEEWKPTFDVKRSAPLTERTPTTLQRIAEEEYLFRTGGHRIFFGKIQRPVMGIAVDAGTTAVEAVLVDLEDGSIQGREGEANRQLKAGVDIVTRISYGAGSEGSGDNLRKWLVESIEETIRKLRAARGVKKESSVACAISGNVFIMHSLLGRRTDGLARFPFSPPLPDQLLFPDTVPISLHPSGCILLFPSPGAFVGGDLVAGAISLSLDRVGPPALFIDIGANTEILARHGDRWVAASAPSGGAFEGPSIKCGKMALPGAVTGCHFDSELMLHVLGGTEPNGISGSGLLSVVGLLISRGIITPKGRILTPAEARGLVHESFVWRLVEMEGENAFLLFLPERGKPPVYLTQSDVRNFQLAKGATRAALEMVLHEASISPEKVTRVYVSGAFGRGVDEEALILSGVIPGELKGKLVKAGNTSLAGAYLSLVDRDAMTRARELAEHVEVLPLGGSEKYSEKFMEYLDF